MSKPRDVARILGRTEAANPSNLALGLAGSTEPTTQYDSIGLLPVTGLTAGTQAFVTSTNRLYVSNGSGWYNTALINATPALSLSSSGTIALTPGSATTITMTATDSDNADANLVLSLESGGDLFKFATVSQDSSVVTITPRTEDSASTLGSDGSATLTFKASDGINQATVQNTFTLAFGPDWTGSLTESKIVASDAQAGDDFGASVEISGDGSYAISGAPYEDAGGNGAGAAYIYLRTGSSWAQQAKLTASDAQASDYFSYSAAVSISTDGTYAFVGAILEATGGSFAGAAYVFIRSGTSWSQQAKLVASNPSAYDKFGGAASISGDGSYAIAGSPGEDTTASGSGAAYVFVRSGTSWSQQQMLKATDAGENHNFGYSTYMSTDGTYAIIGAYDGDNTAGNYLGKAYIFTRSGSTWSQQAKLTASDAAAGDKFGFTVAINDDGTYAIVGTPYHDTGGSDAGAAYIYARSGTSWTQQAKIQSSDIQASDNFGYTVSISGDGSHVMVGAEKEDTTGSDAGSAYIFKRSGSSWSQIKKLQAADAAADDKFGHSVSIASSDGTYSIVGANGEDAGGSNAGAAYIFEAG